MYTQTASSDYIPVPEFYQDKSVFLTGGTGFLGKVLIEKLLRSCPGIKNVYILMRPKRNQDIDARLANVTSSPIFDKLREERPSDLRKILTISGDLMEPELGISKSDQSLLIKTVSIVFHSAASVKFNEDLKSSVSVNVLATKRLVELCHQMLKLEAFIHVSTAYSNCDKKEVKEVCYPTPYDPEKIIECVGWMDDGLAEAITPTLVGKHPNIYTFTKALTEQMLMKESGKLPIAIVRPSIVMSSMKEPVPGWVDSWNGPSGLIATAASGIFKTFLAGKNCVADLVPVDFVINSMIAAAWKTATTNQLHDMPNEIEVYNCCTGIQNPVTWGSFTDRCVNYFIEYPVDQIFWYPSVSCTSYWFLNKMIALFFQLLPAYLIDTTYRLIGKKPIMVKIQNKLETAGQSLAYFSLGEWRFYDDNIKHLNSILSDKDRETFYFDVRDIDWPKYLETYVLGIRSFIFKENISLLPMARKKMQLLFWLHRFTQFIGIVLIWKFLHSMTDFAFSLWTFFEDYNVFATLKEE